MTKKIDIVQASFEKDTKRNFMFLKQEAKIKNPINPRSRPRSETLLSAYVALTCGRFETFLQDVFYEAASDIKARIGKSTDARIIKHDKFHQQNILGFVTWVGKVKGVSKPTLIAKIQAFAHAIQGDGIHPEAFKPTNANPNTATLVDMFKRFGIDDPLKKLSASYHDAKARTFSAQLIEQKLDAFVRRRHEAAHHGAIAGVSRLDAEDDHVFVTALSQAVRDVLKAHLAAIV